MSDSQPKKDVLASNFVKDRIWYLINKEKDATVRAVLARLRRGVGIVPGSDPDIWADTLAGLPDEILSETGKPTQGEWAVHIALTLFATHQQGNDMKVKCMHQENQSLGKAIRKLADIKGEGGEDAVKRRFNAMATSESIDEFANHLRGMVQLLKAEGVGLDYVQLTQDLYWFQNPDFRENLRLKWGQDYYRVYKASAGSSSDE